MSASHFALAALALVAAGPAMAADVDEGGARQRIAAAGYSDVAEVHQGNLGEWMAEAQKDGRRVLVVVHRDGSVALRQQVDTPPVQAEPVPAPAKP